MVVTRDTRPARSAPTHGDVTEPRDRFLAFAFAAADLLIEATPDGTISFATGAFRARFGIDAQTVIGRPVGSLVSPLDQGPLAMALASVGLRGRIAPIVLRLADPAATPCCLSAMLMPERSARLCLTFGPVPLAPLAGSGNESLLADGDKALSRAAEQRVRDGVTPTALGLFELKGWGTAKNKLSVADQQSLRSDIASVLQTASPGTLASEMAEGRFGVLTAGRLDMAAIAERLSALVRGSPAAGHTTVENTEINLDAGGLAPAQAARALRFALSRFTEKGVKAVDAAVGRDGLASIVARAEQRTRVMQETIAARRFRVLFQPVVSLATRQVCHYEALLRPVALVGQQPQSPQEFVAFAETMGLAEALDIAVLEQTCSVLAGAQTHRVAVNVSGLSMQSVTYRAHVLGLLADRDLAARLILELTETAEIEDLAEATESMTQFRAAGIELCLDDFGAGASAFRYLRNFKVDVIKIDGGYVQAASRSARERAFVVSMLDLARSAGARTVAEMIETEEQAKQMRDLGVDLGQGWLFGKPGGLPGATH